MTPDHGRHGVLPGVLLAILVASGACGGEDSDSSRVMARPAAFDEVFAAVDTVTPEQTERHLVARISELEFTPGSGFLVLDGSESDLKVFRRDGSLARVIGREGGGPGEFRDPLRLDTDANGDVHVYDGDLNRIQVFSRLGELLETVDLTDGIPFVDDFSVRPDSGYVLLDAEAVDAGDERVLVLADSSGRVLSRHLPILNVIPDEEVEAGPTASIWQYPRTFTMDAVGDTIYVLASLENTIWRAVFPGPRVESREVTFDGYLPPTTPPEDVELRTPRDGIDWFQSRHLSGFVRASSGLVVWPLTRGEWPRGEPTYLVANEGWDGPWRALSGDGLPKIMDVAGDTVVAATNPATDRMRFVLYTLADAGG